MGLKTGTNIYFILNGKKTFGTIWTAYPSGAYAVRLGDGTIELVESGTEIEVLK